MPEVIDAAFLRKPGTVVGGMNNPGPNPTHLQIGELARATNICIRNGLPTTRPGVIVREFTGSPDDLTAQALARVINNTPDTPVAATAALNVVNLAAVKPGAAGNTIELSSESSCATVSGPVLEGGAPGVAATGSITLVNSTGTINLVIGTLDISVMASAGGAASVLAARVGNVQGCRFFNPAKGQGGIEFAASNAMVLMSIAGKKYTLTFQGRGRYSKAILTDVSNGIAADPALHLVWWAAWENIALAQDGNSACWVWQYPNQAKLSSGYDTTNKQASSVPNGGTVMGYAHGYGVVIVLSRFALVSNALNQENLSQSGDLLKFSDQTYWNTGQYFVPPSEMGNVVAAAILPQRNTVHGHGDLMLHCEDGIFSIDLNVAPRSSWSSTPMVRCALLHTGAVGPYAIALSDGDQIFRTRKGLQTLRSAAAESTLEGDPETVISDKVKVFMEGDYPRWLRFASVAKWEQVNRLLATVQPIVSGPFRWHRGVVVLNLLPDPSESQTDAWEGLWTLPAEAAGIVQLTGGIFDGEERQFAVCRGMDMQNRLAEFTEDMQYDLLSDGTKQPVSCQVITRGMDLEEPLDIKQFREGTIYWKNVQGMLTWGVWVKRENEPDWSLWRSGTVNAGEPADGLSRANPWAGKIPLGQIPEKKSEGRWTQFLIRWQGYASLEALRVRVNQGDADTDKFDGRPSRISYTVAAGQSYNDFEYPEGSDWLTNPL